MQLNGAPNEPIAAAPHPEGPQARVVSGFWRRAAAFALDSLLIGLVGFVLGLILFDTFARLGAWGRLIGFAIALPYFAVLNSSIGHGQTIGKRLAKIEVVDAGGERISLLRSSARYTIFAVPFFLNGALIPASLATEPLSVFLSLVVFGVGGATLYLFTFNRRTRQSLHDLAVKTCVVRSGPSGGISLLPIWKGHLIVVAVWLLLVPVLTVAVVPRLARMDTFAELGTVQRAVQESGKVNAASVVIGKTWNPGGTKRYLSVTAVWKEQPQDYSHAVMETASIVMATYPRMMDQDVLHVRVTYGFDIGIAHAWKSYDMSYSPKEWEEKIKKWKSQE